MGTEYEASAMEVAFERFKANPGATNWIKMTQSMFDYQQAREDAREAWAAKWEGRIQGHRRTVKGVARTLVAGTVTL